MANERGIRKEIFSKVKELYRLRKQKEALSKERRIGYAGRVYNAKELISLIDASLDFWLTAGRFARRFEEDMENFIGVKHCSLVNSGSSANLLAVSALTSLKLGSKRLKPGDEVITTACCFPTTLAPIIQNNLVPVFVDVEPGTYNIKTNNLEKAVSRKTKAVFIAHTLGNPANLSAVMKLTRKYDLWLIEDNCDSLGAKYGGRYTGTFGHLATLSFYPAHHITMGEGGAVLTNDSLLNKIINSFRDWGRDCWCESGQDDTCRRRFSWKLGKLPFGYDHKYIYSHIGYNLKVTDMQAAIGVEQLKKLKGFIKRRSENFNILYRGLQEYKDIFILPEYRKSSEPSWFCFPLTIKRQAGFNRGELLRFLESKNIQTRLIFAGNILRQPAFKDIKCRIIGNLNNSDMVMKNSFFLGLYPKLGRREMEYILKTIKIFLMKKELN